MEGARTLRHDHVSDPDFRSYASQARGYVHFFLDREDTNERILVKTDQIALAVFWRAPDETRQRIIGLRDEKSLPTNINYHLDHLTVVQNEFGDRIRIGDGDEVEAVLHPVAPGAEAFYDYFLADSVTLTLQGRPDPIRVYELLVRPKDPDLPAFIGSVFLDRASGAIVRMNFTFTPTSYVDPYLDRIQISLENGLWNGRHWLPFRQQLEIRREVPWLDIPAGSVIKGWFEVRDYEINATLPEDLFMGPAVTALPKAAREAFPFEEGIHAHLDTEGLSPPPEMAEIRSMALRLSEERYLSGLRRSRLFLPKPVVSSSLRFNRAEGLFLGGGVSFALAPTLATALHGGFAFGSEKPRVTWLVTGGERRPASGILGLWNAPREMGLGPAIPGLLNSFSSLLLDRDYQDLLFTTGAQLFHTWNWPGEGSLEVRGRWETHRSARDVVSSLDGNPRFRPTLPTEEGTWRSLEVGLLSPTPWPPLSLRLKGLVGGFQGRSFVTISGGVDFQRDWLTRGLELQGSLQAGTARGDAPRQALFLLGGRETVPGYPFRSFAGDEYWLLNTLVSRGFMSPWLRLRAFASAGGTRYGGQSLPEPWPTGASSGFLLSGGLGLGIGWDILHLDLARGLREGGEWEFIFSVKHAFWSWL